MPFTLNGSWTLVLRTIIPTIFQEAPPRILDDDFGLSDSVQSFFFVPPMTPNEITVGFGPVFLWPTATEDSLGAEKWGAGPTAVILRQQNGWTYGVLAQSHLMVAADTTGESKLPPGHPRGDPILKALGRAWRWQRLIEAGASVAGLAEAESMGKSYLCRPLRLTLLSPAITEAILDGTHPKDMLLADLICSSEVGWAEQNRRIFDA